MKKFLVLLALCMVLSVVLVACQQPDDPTTDESTAGSTEAPTTEAPTTEAPTTEAPTTEEPTTEEPTTQAPTTEEPTTEPPAPPADPVSKHISFDELDMILDGTETDVFTPGGSANWDKIATVEDYHVQYLKVWGWLAWVNENIGVYGYSIDGGEAVYDDAFTVAVDPEDAAAGKPVYDAAMGTGAKSVSRFAVMVPVRDLQGEHTITVYAKDVVGTEEIITTFTMNKAVDPDAPVALVTGASMYPDITGGIGFNSVVASADGNYITIDTIGQGDPYYTIPALNGKGYVATHVAIKYRSTSSYNGAEMFVGSGAGRSGQGDNVKFTLTCDGNWQLAVVDVSGLAAVTDNVINYVSWDPFDNVADATIDVAYIALFTSAEAAVAHFDKTMVIADTSNTFKSDVDSNEVGASLSNADISSIMVLRAGTNGWKVVEIDGAKYYELTGIDAITADMDGAYYFKANIKDAINGSGIGFVVRGYNGTVSSDDNVPYKLTNFYETDDAGFCGGSGIYAYVNNGKLSIVVKYYDAAKGTRVGNKIYNLACEGNELVMADNGYTVSIMVNGVTYATIDLSGSVAYEDITTTPAGGVFATKAVVTLKDGTTETIENTLVSATVNSQVGLTCRASQLRFSAIEVGGYTAIEVPALEIVEPEPADPNAPIAEGNAEYLAGAAGTGANQTTATLSEDGKYVTLTSGEGEPKDPNFWVLPGGSAIGGVQVIGLKYRTTVAGGGEFFVGSTNITGGADEVKFDYIADGEWHVIYVDLTAHAAVVDGLVNYIRYDYFMDAAVGSTIDVESIVLFSSLKAAYAYYGETYAGTLNAPLTVGETLAAVGELAEGTTTAGKFFTTGVVTAIGKTGSYYGSVYFTDGENEMLIYTLNPMEGMPELKVGDTITVNGYIKNYKGTIEYASNGSEYVYIVAHKAAEVETPVVETLVVDFQNIDDSDIVPFTDAQFAQKVIFGNYNTVVNLGTYDLSLYSKAVIKYATDVNYKNDGLAQIGFKSSDATWGFAGTFNDTDIIASAAMTDAVPDTFWALTGLRDAEIDLSGVTYNGDVWVGAYNVEGQIYAIESITLIP